MSTIFRARKNAEEAGSGGKIRRRRVLETRSPYARPTTASPPPAENPNRLLGLISPASRVITGAAKMISTVFFPETPPSSSSSEDDGDDDISSQGDDRSNQNDMTSEADLYNEKNLQLTIRKNEIKLAIEQLLMQETFSRDECNRLVKIIESRVVEAPLFNEGGDASRSISSDRAIGTSFTLPGGHVSDICNTAVMEAKKWLEEKKTDSSLQLEKSQGTFTSNVTEGELGSPVLMAKSYMKSRPPWASPTVGHTGFQPSPPIGFYHSKEETPYSVGVHALSSSKDLKRSSADIGSWNTVEGSRRVRFRTADDTNDNSQHNKKTSVEDERRDDEFDSDSLARAGSEKQSAGLPTDVTKNNASLVTGHEALITSSTLPMGDHNQASDGTQITAIQDAEDLEPDTHDGPLGQSTAMNSKVSMASENIKPAVQSDSIDQPGFNGTDELSMKPKGKKVMTSSQKSPLGLKETDSFDDSQPLEDGTKHNEVNGSHERVANGHSSIPSLSAKVNVESSLRPNKEERRNQISANDGKEGSCELLSEASVEIPDNDEMKDFGGSLNSSSRLSKEPMHTETESISSPGTRKRSSTRIEKQQMVKKTMNYSRRGRGRGK